MPSQTKKFIKWGGLAIVALIALSYLLQSVWISPEIRARVVDEGGKPVKGAVVLLVWMVKAPLNETNYGPIAMHEALTDENGGFVIPGWGPRFDFSGHLQQGEPKTYIFHPDFYPVTENNLIKDAPLKQFAPVYIRYHMHGKEFQLTRFQGSLKEYEQTLGYLARQLELTIWFSKNCVYQQMPRILTGLHKVKMRLKEQTGEGSSLPDIYYFAQPVIEERCGDAKQFFKEYLK
jgi:hypothetical protein